MTKILFWLAFGVGFFSLFLGHRDHLAISNLSEHFVKSFDKFKMKWFARKPSSAENLVQKKELIFTKQELWKWYRGESGSKGVYVGFLGKVYDVEKGKQHYGPEGGYHFFAGRDGTRAFVTGDFSELGLTDNLEKLDYTLFLGINDWQQFYQDSYTCVGKVIGYFYDSDGNPTEELKMAQLRISEALKMKEDEEKEKRRLPSCNSMSSQSNHAKVWCTKKSGGVDRDWVGVPRLYRPPGAASSRCVCVRTTGPPSRGEDRGLDRGDLDHEWIKTYPDCEHLSEICVLSEPTTVS